MPREIKGGEALKIAKDSKPKPIPNAMKLGSMVGKHVSLMPDDVSGPGTLPVKGLVGGEDDLKVIIERKTAETGTIHVHFPKHALGACF